MKLADSYLSMFSIYVFYLDIFVIILLGDYRKDPGRLNGQRFIPEICKMVYRNPYRHQHYRYV